MSIEEARPVFEFLTLGRFGNRDGALSDSELRQFDQRSQMRARSQFAKLVDAYTTPLNLEAFDRKYLPRKVSRGAADFDLDSNRRISPEESAQAFEYVFAPSTSNGDGKLEARELPKLIVSEASKEIEAFQDTITDYQDAQEGKNGMGLEEFDATFMPKQSLFKGLADTTLFRCIQLRRTLEDSILASMAESSFRDAKAAEFGVTRARATNNDMWRARGALSVPLVIASPSLAPKGLSFREDERHTLLIRPSITFDRVTNERDPAKEVNDVIYRLGGEGLWYHGPDFASGIVANVAYGSDFDGDSGVAAVQLDYEPVLPVLGVGLNQFVPGTRRSLEYRLRARLRAEYGDVLSTGGRENIMKGDEFLRAGPSIQLTLTPTGRPLLDKVELSVNYTHLESIGGDNRSASLFEAVATVQLDDEGRLSLQASYRNGKTDLLNTDVDEISVAFGVKF